MIYYPVNVLFLDFTGGFFKLKKKNEFIEKIFNVHKSQENSKMKFKYPSASIKNY